MKKIEALIKGKKLAERLFGNKKRCIIRAIESALDDIERQNIEATDGYNQSLIKLADDNVDYKRVINDLIGYKQTIIDSEETVKVIQAIKDDLDSEVNESDTEEFK